MNASSPYSARLRSLLQTVGISSQKALSQAAGVSVWQIKQLCRGRAAQMRIEALQKLSQTLQVSLTDLLISFSDLSIQQVSNSEAAHSQTQLQQEYQRLQAQLSQQEDQLRQEFQQSVLRSLESWLIQFPTLIYAAQQNPQFPAKSFLPFIRPLEQLLQQWNIEAIESVGAEVAFDPQLHQLMEGTAQAGDRVRIRYVGYRQGEKLLHRAKVSRVD